MLAAAYPQIIAKEICFQNLVNRQALQLFQHDHFAPAYSIQLFRGEALYFYLLFAMDRDQEPEKRNRMLCSFLHPSEKPH